MCLSSRLTRKAQKEAVVKLPEWVTVWKVFGYYPSRNEWLSQWKYHRKAYSGKEHIAVNKPLRTSGGDQYVSGFHCYTSHRVAMLSVKYRPKMYAVPCRIKRSWIATIGEQWVEGRRRICYVTNKIKIPSPKQYFKTHK